MEVYNTTKWKLFIERNGKSSGGFNFLHIFALLSVLESSQDDFSKNSTVFNTWFDYESQWFISDISRSQVQCLEILVSDDQILQMFIRLWNLMDLVVYWNLDLVVYWNWILQLLVYDWLPKNQYLLLTCQFRQNQRLSNYI